MLIFFRLIIVGVIVHTSWATSSGGGTVCSSGEYHLVHRRRFLHTRPLSEPLLGGQEKDGYPGNTSTTFPDITATTATPKDFPTLALPPIYYFEHTSKNNDPYKKLSSSVMKTTRFVPLTRDTSNIHWEKKLPTAPTPQIPLYWINLKRSKIRGGNMVQQFRKDLKLEHNQIRALWRAETLSR